VSLDDPDHSPDLAVKYAGDFMNHADTKDRVKVRFGRNLKAARLCAGLTPQEVALQAGVALGLLIQIESGTSDPDLALVGKLANIVGCAAHELLR
jgi:DNA-binding XRE family transcriptional regulator